MKNRSLWLAVAVSSSLGVGLNACSSLSESCNTDNDPNCVPNEDAGDGGGGTDNGGGGTDNGGGGGSQRYIFVLIADNEDPSVSSPTETSGVDITAVSLTKGSNEIFAREVHACEDGPGDNGAAPCDSHQNEALGAPEFDGDELDCPSNDDAKPFVSLGGSNSPSTVGGGGYLIVSFGGEEILAGNRLTVYECGNTPEEFDAFVGVSTSLNDDDWEPVILGGTGEVSQVVPTLPVVPIN